MVFLPLLFSALEQSAPLWFMTWDRRPPDSRMNRAESPIAARKSPPGRTGLPDGLSPLFQQAL